MWATVSSLSRARLGLVREGCRAVRAKAVPGRSSSRGTATVTHFSVNIAFDVSTFPEGQCVTGEVKFPCEA